MTPHNRPINVYGMSRDTCTGCPATLQTRIRAYEPWVRGVWRDEGAGWPLRVVEVGGIEPPSHELSTPASPSAANRELSEHEDSIGKHPHALSGIVLSCRSRKSRQGRPTLRCPHPARWAPSGRTGAFIYAASA